MDVVAGLHRDSGEVDRVDGEEVGPPPERLLHHRLAVVEGAPHRENRHCLVIDGRHLASLHLGNTPLREEDHDREPAAASLDGGRARVAAGGHEHRPVVGGPGQEPGHHLQGMVLEAEGRPPEELEHQVVANTGDGCDLGMGEGCSSFGDDLCGVLDSERAQRADDARHLAGASP